jgi:shikimate kinase
MGADYYDPSPRLHLAQPIVVAGQIGCGAPLVGRGVAARTGIRFAEVDRGIEHQAGRSLARIAQEDGIDEINMQAERVIARLIERPPFGIIVLDKAWLPLSCSALLKQATHMVHIDRPIQLLADRLPREVARSGSWLLRGTAPPRGEPRALEPILRERAPLLNAAHTLLHAEHEGESRVATLLLDSLTAISDAEPL